MPIDDYDLDPGSPPRWENTRPWTYAVFDGRGDTRAVVVFVSKIWMMMPNGHHTRTRLGAAMTPDGVPFDRRSAIPRGCERDIFWSPDWLDMVHDGPVGRWVAVVEASRVGSDRWMGTPELQGHDTLREAQAWVATALGLTDVLRTRFYNVCDPVEDAAGYGASHR
jgi:hypothetical protein